MLCVIPPHVVPSREKLENSALNNPHGFGFAIVIPSENRIHVERTMNADESINNFLELRAKYPEGFATWHARWATHGVQTVDNCHPFQVGKDTKTYLAHNGILSVLEDSADLRSDTRIFAEDLLPSIGGAPSLDNPQIWNMLEDFTTGSKVVVLTLNPNAKHQCYLLHEEKGWHDDDGVWWSNDSCYISKWEGSWKSITAPTAKYDYKDGFCMVCEELLPANSLDKCAMCGTCQDCYMVEGECLCYKPTTAKGWHDADYDSIGWGLQQW